MKHLSAAAFAISLIVLGPRAALAQGSGSLEGFGAFSVNELSASRPSFGGALAVNLVPSLQAIGEFGRIGNVLPTVTQSLLSLTPLDVRVSALYGEGGIRFTPGHRSPFSPYVEATAGIARMDIGIAGLGPTVDVITSAALSFVPRTERMAGVGGGLRLQGGPLSLDLGYRYKQIFGNNIVATLLGAGEDLHSHQFRVGVGVRF